MSFFSAIGNAFGAAARGAAGAARGAAGAARGGASAAEKAVEKSVPARGWASNEVRGSVVSHAKNDVGNLPPGSLRGAAVATAVEAKDDRQPSQKIGAGYAAGMVNLGGREAQDYLQAFPDHGGGHAGSVHGGPEHGNSYDAAIAAAAREPARDHDHGRTR